MFANTLTITISGTPHVLTRVNQDNFGSLYRKKTATDVMTLQFRNNTDKSGGKEHDRHNMFFEHRVYQTPTEAEKLYTVSTVYRLRDGSDPTALKAVAAGYATLLAAQKDGLIDGES